MISTKEKKNALRLEIRALTADLPEGYLKKAGREICAGIIGTAAFREADTVMAYYSSDDEPDMSLLLDRIIIEGKKLVLPISLKGGIIDARTVNSLSELVPGRFGIMEPGPGTLPADISRIDLVIVPCVAAGRDGSRLGHGMGYYDRFLSLYKSIRPDGKLIMTCPSLKLRDSVPEEPHDLRILPVISECSGNTGS